MILEDRREDIPNVVGLDPMLHSGGTPPLIETVSSRLLIGRCIGMCCALGERD